MPTDALSEEPQGADAVPLQLLHLVRIHIATADLDAVKRTRSSVHSVEHLRSQLNYSLSACYSRAFSLRPFNYGLRGKQPYFKPCGWQRVARLVQEKHAFKSWAVAYHGTTLVRALLILEDGLMPPEGPRDVVHGQAYSSTKQTVYVSPSIEYAAYPVYGCFAPAGEDTWVQAVLQVRVRPDTFSVRRGSLVGKRYWDKTVRFDPNFPTADGLEWLVEDSNNVVVAGIMLRVFGRGADPLIYGETASKVSYGESGPEYEWTRMRLEEFRSAGHFVEAQ